MRSVIERHQKLSKNNCVWIDILSRETVLAKPVIKPVTLNFLSFGTYCYFCIFISILNLALMTFTTLRCHQTAGRTQTMQYQIGQLFLKAVWSGSTIFSQTSVPFIAVAMVTPVNQDKVVGLLWMITGIIYPHNDKQQLTR